MWDLVRKDVGIKLLGRSVSTVPVIDRTNYFDILGVYKKLKKTKGIRNICAIPRYQILGRLEDFLVISYCDPFRLQNIGPHDMSTKIEPFFEYSVRDMFDIEVKEVIVKIYSTKHQSSDIHMIEHREIYVDKRNPILADVDKLYVISEVFICNHIYLLFRLGDKEMVRNIRDNRIPVGFRSRKFRIKKDGSLVYVRKVKPALSSSDAIWLRPDGYPVISSSTPSILRLSYPINGIAVWEEGLEHERVQIIMEPQMPASLGEQNFGACQMRIPQFSLQHALPSSEFLAEPSRSEVYDHEMHVGEGQQSISQIIVEQDGTFLIVPTPIRKTQSDINRLYATDDSEPPVAGSVAGPQRVSKIIVDEEGKFHVIEELTERRPSQPLLQNVDDSRDEEETRPLSKIIRGPDGRFYVVEENTTDTPSPNAGGGNGNGNGSLASIDTEVLEYHQERLSKGSLL